ncbi:MAG TPA: hypothetical protein VHI97_03950, partial [Actinomycetota bacterium]|nr:hypothetical protein [Actinomycetota bacterium]
NYFWGAGAVYTTVELPRDVTMTDQSYGGRAFKIRSKARFAGFALVYERDGATEVWVGGRLKAAGSQTRFFVPADPLAAVSDTHILVAGTYRLYALSSDGSTTRVRLRLPELSGSTRLHLTKPAPFRIRFPEVHSDAAGQVHSFDATGRFTTGAGALFGGSWFATPAQGPTAAETCFFEGRPPPELGGRASGCAGLGVLGVTGLQLFESQTQGASRVDPRMSPGRFVNFVHGGSVWPDGDSRLPGRHSILQTATTAAVPEDLQAMAFWLGF